MRKIQPEKMEGVEEKMEAYYPSVHFDGTTLTEGKDWKVGKKYRVTLELEMTGMSMRKNKSGKDHEHYDFDIIGIETHGEIKGKTKRYS